MSGLNRRRLLARALLAAAASAAPRHVALVTPSAAIAARRVS